MEFGVNMTEVYFEQGYGFQYEANGNLIKYKSTGGTVISELELEVKIIRRQ